MAGKAERFHGLAGDVLRVRDLFDTDYYVISHGQGLAMRSKGNPLSRRQPPMGLE